ncbi:MAG: hypothetical protein V1709_06045 [Planctomycetota bacterium]
MAFAYAVSSQTIAGNKRLVFGTFTNAANDTGGAIVTGLSTIDWFCPIFTSHSGSTGVKCTISGGTVTIVVPDTIIPQAATSDGVDGNWIAIGN